MRSSRALALLVFGYKLSRSGEGPLFLECRTYRLLEHCGPNEDYDLGYRTPDEVEHWLDQGPLEKAKGLVSESEAAEMAREIGSQIDQALVHARSAPFPERLIPEEAADEV